MNTPVPLMAGGLAMRHSLRPADIAVLLSLADYVALTTNQLCDLHDQQPRTMRRVLQTLYKAGLAEAATEITGGRGHPERVTVITGRGYELLVEKGVLAQEPSTGPRKAINPQCIDHQLLENWTRIRLHQMERSFPQLSVRFLAARSPLLSVARDGQPIPLGGSDDEQRARAFDLLPDGVFAITHNGQQRTLLFFLEIDMGTESIESGRPDHPCIRRKIDQYVLCFSSKAYKQYEPTFCSVLNGFRVLFIANTTSRLHALCRHIARWPHTDFIWLSEENSLLNLGIGASIWIRGGQLDQRLESILDGAMPKGFRTSVASPGKDSHGEHQPDGGPHVAPNS
jgi:hypothetical protein